MAFSPFQINNLRRESEEVAKAKFNEFPKEGEIIQEKIAISRHFKVCTFFPFIIYLSSYDEINLKEINIFTYRICMIVNFYKISVLQAYTYLIILF